MAVTEENSKNRLKNYLLLILLFVICMWLVVYLCQLYKINDAEKKKIPVIRGNLEEIYESDLEPYILENPTKVIYMCTSNDEVCRNFERDFKKLLKQKDYQNQIVYLNLTDLNQDEFVEKFNAKYNYKIKLTTKYPAFIQFDDGKIKSVLQGKEDKKLTITKVKQFLELNDIGE